MRFQCLIANSIFIALHTPTVLVALNILKFIIKFRFIKVCKKKQQFFTKTFICGLFYFYNGHDA